MVLWVCNNNHCTRIAADSDYQLWQGCRDIQKRYHATLRGTCKTAIVGSKRADRRKGCNIDELDYITFEWMESEWTKQEHKCYYRHCKRLMQYKDCMLSNGLTIERLDNKKPHTKPNCVLACHHCNCKHTRAQFMPGTEQSTIVINKQEDGRCSMALRTTY